MVTYLTLVSTYILAWELTVQVVVVFLLLLPSGSSSHAFILSTLLMVYCCIYTLWVVVRVMLPPSLRDRVSRGTPYIFHRFFWGVKRTELLDFFCKKKNSFCFNDITEWDQHRQQSALPKFAGTLQSLGEHLLAPKRFIEFPQLLVYTRFWNGCSQPGCWPLILWFR